MLWAIALILVAVALAFSVWPLLRAPAPPPTDGGRAASMRALYRDRVAELERETAAGQLDPETRAEVLDELGANLLDEFQHARAGADVDPAESPPGSAGSSPGSADAAAGGRVGLAAGLLALLLPLAGAAVYLSAGEPDAVSIAGAAEVLRLDPQDGRAELEAWRDRLARRVANRPEDAQSWYLLGISRLQLGEFAAAADAFASARQRLQGEPNIDLYWLQSRYLAAGGVLDERARAVAGRILEARPNHPLVLEMLAIEAYRAGNFRESVTYLNRALSNFLAPDQTAALLAGLDQARSRMEPISPSVDVQVSAAPGAPAGASVFVIARPPGGGMPYAVVRRPAGLLPLAVRLDDTVSMSEGRPLSAAEGFEVVVRLSRSGTATPGPGDWEWRSEPLQASALTEPLRLDARLAPAARPAAEVARAHHAAASGRSAAADSAAADGAAADDKAADSAAADDWAADSAAADQKAAAGVAAVAGMAVDVKVPSVEGAPAGATLFVIARPPGGGMPYAVVRRPAALPVAVRLDDDASMTASRRLSDAGEFEVVVRLSVSGNAMPGPGDWEWRSGTIEPGAVDGPVALEARLAPRGSD